MSTLSSIAIEEKNKLATDSVFLLAIELTIPNQSSLYLVKNNEAITWNGHTWEPCNFNIDEISDLGTGENPQVGLRVSNELQIMEEIIHEYDLYTKNNGYSPIMVDIYVINTKAVALDGNCAPEVEYSFELTSPQTDPHWASFTLGAPNPWTKRVPLNRMLRNFCRYRKFKTDPRCGYAGSETVCDHTLTRCRELGNSKKFGGTPAVGSGGLRLA